MSAPRSESLWPTLVATVVHAGLVATSVVVWHAGSYWLAALAPLWLATVWMNHAALARLHEAIHGMLARPRWLNEVLGAAVGTAAWIPMSVYRYVHLQHHAWLGTPRDPEFVPYSDPAASRSVRRGYAASEIVLGAWVTPSLYTGRTLRAWGSHGASMRRRIGFELPLMMAFWIGLVISVSVAGVLVEFTVAWLIPAWLTGVVQTLRKFTEHLGLGGDTIMSRTRMVLYRGRIARLLFASQVHVEHHPTHHRHPAIPCAELPDVSEELYAADPPPGPCYPNHWVALRDALAGLGDPRVGTAITGDPRPVR